MNFISIFFVYYKKKDRSWSSGWRRGKRNATRRVEHNTFAFHSLTPFLYFLGIGHTALECSFRDESDGVFECVIQTPAMNSSAVVAFLANLANRANATQKGGSIYVRRIKPGFTCTHSIEGMREFVSPNGHMVAGLGIVLISLDTIARFDEATENRVSVKFKRAWRHG